MERVELKRFFEQMHLYIDEKPVAALVIAETDSQVFNCDTNTRTIQKVPTIQVKPPWVDPYRTSSEDGPTLFTDEPRGARAEAEAWRANMISELRVLLGPDRNVYQTTYGSDANLSQALRDSANGFGLHFTAFFEILCQWIASRPVGDTRSEFVPLASGEPPPGVVP